MPPRVAPKRGAAAAAAVGVPDGVEAAAAARSTPKRKTASTAEVRAQEAAVERKSLEDKKLAADIAKAAVASRREAFDSYSSSSEGGRAITSSSNGRRVVSTNTVGCATAAIKPSGHDYKSARDGSPRRRCHSPRLLHLSSHLARPSRGRRRTIHHE